MASTYPTTIDAFTNPTAASLLTSPSHAQQHSDINDAMEAVQTKLAIGNTVLGTYTAYTPTVSGVTLGNATFSVRYARVNNLVHYYGTIIFGSTTVVTGASLNLSLPINCASGFTGYVNPFGIVEYDDASAGALYAGVAFGIFSASVARLRVFNASGTYTTTTDLSSTVPMTWAVSDKIMFNLTYEAA